MGHALLSNDYNNYFTNLSHTLTIQYRLWNLHISIRKGPRINKEDFIKNFS